MKKYFVQLVIPIFIIVLSSGCISSSSTKLRSAELVPNYETNRDGYNQYEALLKTDVSIRERIIILIQLSYLGYDLYPNKCLVHIKRAMELSTKIDHKHKRIGELYILYAKLHKRANENYDPLPILKEGVDVLGNYITKELKRRNPYRKELDRFYDHRSYVWQVNECKEYMRNAGYDVGKDKKVSIFYGISRIGKLCITVAVWPYKLRNGGRTLSSDIYYYDFLSYYLDLAMDGFDILDMPNHRHAASAW